MLSDTFLRCLLFLSIISITNAWFDFRIHYCRFKCVDPCKNDDDMSNPHGDAEKTKGYYFRDYTGVIPPDAYPLGNANQYPQTYVGLVYDPDDNGLFITTIVEGMNHVFVPRDGIVSKRNESIQILCTMEKGRMRQITGKLTNSTSLGKILFMGNGIQGELNSKGEPVSEARLFISIVTKCNVKYAGSKKGRNPVEYVTFDGKSHVTTDYDFLIYDNNTFFDEKNKGQPFISHHYEYTMRPNSIIPKFYKQVNIGSCSIICTNQGLNKRAKFENDKEAAMSMAYYWKPSDIFRADRSDAFKAGVTSKNLTVNLGQSYSTKENWYNSGEVIGRSIILVKGRYILHAHDFNVFSTKYPESFEWIPSNADTFEEMDKSFLVRAGRMNNGTYIYFCRDMSRGGSLQTTKDAVNCVTEKDQFVKNFEVLRYVPNKK